MPPLHPSPAPETPTEVTEMLNLASKWLGQSLELDPGDVSIVEQRGDIQTSRYADIFATEYGNLVGMPSAADLLALYREGKDTRGTGPFTLEQMKQHQSRSVLDTCAGCKYDQLFLAGAHRRGEIDVSGGMTANEVDVALGRQGMLNVGLVEYVEAPLPIDVEETRIFWQHLAEELGEGNYDCTTCLGNSLSHLSDLEQRRASAANFALVTSRGGVCIVDTRNFDKMLANAEAHRAQALAMLSGNEEEAASNRALFPGSIANSPVYIGPDRVIIAYVRQGTNKPHALVQFYPLSREELVTELATCFGKVEVFHDRRKQEISDEALAAPSGPATIQCVCTEPQHDAARRILEQEDTAVAAAAGGEQLRALLS